MNYRFKLLNGQILTKILLPSQQVIVFQQEYNSLKQVVCHTMKEIQRLNNEKKEILAINFVPIFFYYLF